MKPSQALKIHRYAIEQAVGLDPLPAPTQHLAGRASGRRLRDWLPSASNLRKTESALHEYLGLLAWRWDHPG